MHPVSKSSRNTPFLLALAVVMALLIWLAIVMLHSPHMPATGDYPEWAFHGVLFRDVLRGHPDPGYILKNYPVPNSLTTVGLGVMMLVMPWQIAVKLWLVFGTLLGMAGAVFLQTSITPRQSWKIIAVPAAMLVGINFWYGFENFLLGVYLALFFTGLLMRRRTQLVPITLLLIAIFFTHMIPWGFAVVLLGMYAWQHRSLRVLLAAVPSCLLCVWYFAGRVMHGEIDAKAGMASTVPVLSPMFPVFKINTVLKSWGFVDPIGPGGSALLNLGGYKLFLFLFLANALFATVVVVLAVKTVRSDSSNRGVWYAVIIFFALALMMPGAAAGISDPGARMMQVAFAVALCLVTADTSWQRTTLGVCAAVLLAVDAVLLSTVLMDPGHYAARTRKAHPLEGFASVYFADRMQAYDEIEDGRRDLTIYPTAMFVKK